MKTDVLAFNKPIAGSYSPEECIFLLKPIEMAFSPVDDKESLIQSGQLHYSELISQEHPPSKEYTDLFFKLTEQYKARLAQELMILAKKMIDAKGDNIVILSLARAGTPIGVLLHRIIRQKFDKNVTHYSISIIRDRGIDETALDYVLAQGHSEQSIVFVDGWTAKGVITRELHQSVERYNQSRQTQISKELYVVSDIGATADVQATFDDYTIPSALMNSTVSGLISRSILNEQIGEADFHGCVSYRHLEPYDLSRWFVDEIYQAVDQELLDAPNKVDKDQRRQETEQFLKRIMSDYGISNRNRIKPGIAEATRALLRRVPDVLLLKKLQHIDTLHLEQLAAEKNVDIVIDQQMPFGACSLIKDVLRA